MTDDWISYLGEDNNMRYILITILLCIITSCSIPYTYTRTSYRNIAWHDYNYYASMYNNYYYRGSYHWGYNYNQYYPINVYQRNYYGRNFFIHQPIITTRYGEKVYQFNRNNRNNNNNQSGKFRIRINRRRVNLMNSTQQRRR